MQLSKLQKAIIVISTCAGTCIATMIILGFTSISPPVMISVFLIEVVASAAICKLVLDDYAEDARKNRRN